MREIKFRAWTGTRMITNQDELFTQHIDWGMEKVTACKHIYSPEEMPLMQYTGLKDKNGVEIYEGDILRDNGLVRWHQQQCCFTFKNMILEGNDDILCIAADAVIGNIHENPELLEQ